MVSSMFSSKDSAQLAQRHPTDLIYYPPIPQATPMPRASPCGGQIFGSTPKRGHAALHQRRGQALLMGLHQRRGQAPSTGNFSDWFLINSSAISAAQNAYTQAVIFEVTKAIRTALDQLHFAVKSFCDAVIPRKTEHPGHFFAPIMQRLAQGAQRREGRFSKLIDFIQ